VGSGLYGAVFAHEMNKAGKRCLVIDKKDHAGGNTYCENVVLRSNEIHQLEDEHQNIAENPVDLPDTKTISLNYSLQIKINHIIEVCTSSLFYSPAFFAFFSPPVPASYNIFPENQ
jgi:hypothetical protein